MEPWSNHYLTTAEVHFTTVRAAAKVFFEFFYTADGLILVYWYRKCAHDCTNRNPRWSLIVIVHEWRIPAGTFIKGFDHGRNLVKIGILGTIIIIWIRSCFLISKILRLRKPRGVKFRWVHLCLDIFKSYCSKWVIWNDHFYQNYPIFEWKCNFGRNWYLVLETDVLITNTFWISN